MPDKKLAVGDRIREYEILEVIGEGGMGAVYRARHVLLDQERAIKVIHSRLAENQDFIDRFIREAKILVKLHHPNLVQLHEFGTLEDGSFFMVMELVRGDTVLNLLRRVERIPLQESVNIIRDAALGLHFAHQQGIIHRDISPDNLLLIELGTGHRITKVIDFGIAKPLFEHGGMTATNVFVGKPEYSSPEQCGFMEEGETIDARSDIYSLGVTFYHMLSGKLPFYSPTPQGYLVKHASGGAKPLSKHFEPGQVPPDLERIVMKMLQRNRTDRYQNLQEFVNDLNALEAVEKDDTDDWTLSASHGYSAQVAVKTPPPAMGKPVTLAPSASQAARVNPSGVQVLTPPPAATPRVTTASRIEIQQIPPATTSSKWPLLVVVALLAVAGVIGYMKWNDAPPPPATQVIEAKPQAQVAKPAAAQTPTPAIAAVAAEPLPVTIDALPWARLKITPEAKDVQMDPLPQDESLTPCAFTLRPGNYFVELTNDKSQNPVVQKIHVEAGGQNNFVFTMPGHDPAQILSSLHPSK